MRGILRKRSVNWVDGMKVRRDHLVQTDDYIDDRVRDAIFLSQSRIQYGHLSAPTGIEITASQGDDQGISVVLTACSGITAGGFRVEIPWGENHIHLLRSGAVQLQKGRDSYVVVRVHEERNPAGEIADETPSRQRDSICRYSLDLLSGEMVVADEKCLAIAKIPSGQSGQDFSYVPPCMRIGAHPILLDTSAKVVSICSEMVRNVTKTVIREMERAIPDKHIIEFARCAGQTIALTIDSLALLYPELPPHRLIAFTAGLARSIRMVFECLPEKKDRALLMSALSKRSEFTQERFEALETDVLKSAAEYTHHDIAPQLSSVSKYMVFLGQMFKAMSVEKGRDMRIVE